MLGCNVMFDVKKEKRPFLFYNISLAWEGGGHSECTRSHNFLSILFKGACSRTPLAQVLINIISGLTTRLVFPLGTGN